mgnify:CR=1 FL=1
MEFKQKPWPKLREDLTLYPGPADKNGAPTWTLHEGREALHISQSESWGQSVVWNPGADKCAQLQDMPDNGYQHMLCVEAARVNTPIEVPAFQSWEAWQQIKL